MTSHFPSDALESAIFANKSNEHSNQKQACHQACYNKSAAQEAF